MPSLAGWLLRHRAAPVTNRGRQTAHAAMAVDFRLSAPPHGTDGRELSPETASRSKYCANDGGRLAARCHQGKVMRNALMRWDDNAQQHSERCKFLRPIGFIPSSVMPKYPTGLVV